jgi:hypothetical protein
VSLLTVPVGAAHAEPQPTENCDHSITARAIVRWGPCASFSGRP